MKNTYPDPEFDKAINKLIAFGFTCGIGFSVFLGVTVWSLIKFFG